jgi:hypothetical protein
MLIHSDNLNLEKDKIETSGYQKHIETEDEEDD